MNLAEGQRHTPVFTEKSVIEMLSSALTQLATGIACVVDMHITDLRSRDYDLDLHSFGVLGAEA